MTMSGHTAPITAMSIHPGASQSKRAHMSDFILTSSMDWSIKLWNPKRRADPYFSFEVGQDVIYDV